MKIRKQHQSRILAVLLLLPLAPLSAQVGNDNPAGVAGIFNGNITTGCSYDPYTGNATRKVTDIVVAGAVGSYGLTFSRICNSRNILGGAWQGSYGWSVGDSNETQNTLPPSTYQVSFPDGRSEIFQSSSSDIYYLHAGAGIPERFQPPDSNLVAYLILADGGKVKFQATQHSEFDHDTHKYLYWYSFLAQAIIDPYGQVTTFTRDANGRLTTVTEPAGRYLQFYYTTAGYIDHVTASDGRTVQYYYTQQTFSGVTFTLLDHVVYYGNAAWTARYRYRASNVSSGAEIYPLLWTCDDPMYPGPMKRIAYVYKTTNNADGSAPVYGQILSENYYDGTNVGAAVSTLTVNSATMRTETRGDLKTRTFTYSTPYRLNWTDFKGVNASQTWDSNQYINSVTDRNGHKTTMTRNALTGAVTSVTSPVASDVVPSSAAGTVTYTYGSSACADANNQDANNPYYVCTATDEGGHVTKFTRDTSKRVTRIDYPDLGYETFTYNSLGEVLSHRMKTNGTETFTYGTILPTNGLKLTYRDPYHASGNPSAWYQYDTLYRLSGVTDALGSASGDVNHTASFAYNTRGQVTTTTLPTDPVDSVRHTIVKTYNTNGDGTLVSVRDQLLHTTSYTYDDYRRRRSMTTPTSHTTNYFYDANGTGNDYTDTDAQPTYVTLPGGERTKATYDANFRKLSLTVAVGTADAATTSYGYDNQGNLTSVISPNEQPGQLYAGKSTVSAYDERNRPKSVTDALGNVTNFKYDTAGRKASVTRPNAQSVTYDSYDAMNRLLQQTATQTPDPSAVTKYTYYTTADGATAPVGLLHTMQDPHLVGTSYNYSYAYDLMGRKTSLTYPPDSQNVQRTEQFTYDTPGRLQTFKNRNGKTQTFTYDALNRMTGFTWNDGLTPSVTFAYDVASRLTEADNVNATITRVYYNDNLLNWDSEPITGTVSWVAPVEYTYDANGNRASDFYPDGRDTRTYTYTGRNQLKTISEEGTLLATYTYDVNGNLSSRTVNYNSTSSSYDYDALDRVTHITHSLTGDTRTFDYGYDNVGNRSWTKRDGGTGDVFGYDLSAQVTAVKLDVPNPDTTPAGSQTIIYDANGNRTSFAPYGTTDTYVINNLNQYATRNSTNATYDYNGNMTTGLDGSLYAYDAQNRLISATKNGTTVTFKYDALNRVVARTINGATAYSVWDGWNLILNCDSGGNWINAYWNGPDGVLAEWNTTTGTVQYCYHDGSGSTSHIADQRTGQLLEWYRYDLHGTPIFYNALNTQLSASNYGIRHLFTGQQWYSELGLYDLRNRFYSPDIGRFLQADPIGFYGDATNLYRYCGNNPLVYVDPLGLFNLGQFLKGFGAFTGGVVVGIPGFATTEFGVGLVGVAIGGAAVSYGIINMTAAFSNDEIVRETALGAPTNPAGLVAATVSGEKAQAIAQPMEDIFDAVTAKGVGERIIGILNVIQDVISSSSGNFPPPGGTTYVDPNICPECDATVERVTVTGTPVPDPSSAGVRGAGYRPHPIGSGISIGPTSFESGTGLYNAFEGGNDVPAGQIGLILGGLPSGNTGWGALGQKPLIL